MSLWTKFANLFRKGQIQRDLDDELASHIEEALANGRTDAEARRSFGNHTNLRESSQDLKLLTALDNLKSDFTFSLRQLWKNKVASAAAILSLALATGAAQASFRLIDALLFRPIQIDSPERLHLFTLHVTNQDGSPGINDSCEYPFFRILSKAIENEAQALAISYPGRADITYAGTPEMEKAFFVYISGDAFPAFHLQAALGRLLTQNDNRSPGAHPVAVISHSYWQRRFAADPGILGKKFRHAENIYEIVGVAPQGFNGMDPGSPTDIFVPIVMNARGIDARGWTWFRTWLFLKPGASLQRAQQVAQAVSNAYREEQTKGFPAHFSSEMRTKYARQPVELVAAAAGYSSTQQRYREPLWILAILVALVLLIACANVANLMTAQTAARARELALRVSIGAGRARLLQLVLIESSLVALAAILLGASFATWAAPYVLGRISPSFNPVQLDLHTDYRFIAFTILLTLGITAIFGILPAIRASSVKPASVLKGGDSPHSKRRLMRALIAVQAGFCMLVNFNAGLFLASFDRLSHHPLGFKPERVVVLHISAQGNLPATDWDLLLNRVRSTPGVESAALATMPLIASDSWGQDVHVPGIKHPDRSPSFLGVSPGWLETMGIPLLRGSDLRTTDMHPGAAIVNEAFARYYFKGIDPVGKTFEIDGSKQTRKTIRIAADAHYQRLREPMPPTAYVPFHSSQDGVVRNPRQGGTIILRSSVPNALALFPTLRATIAQTNSRMFIANLLPQSEFIEIQSMRERLLAELGAFFAAVALILTAIGLYGVLDYGVYQRRRELGIRRALGAPAVHLTWRVSAQILAMLAIGAMAGLAIGIAGAKLLESLLFGVKPSDWQMLAIPLAAIACATLLAAVPPILRALHIDPAKMLRAE